MRALPPAGAGALLLTALLTGCGISDTDPVEAGDPVLIQATSPAEGRVFLFFRSADGALVPVSRPRSAKDAPSREGVPSAHLIWALFEGPSADERAAGLTGGLPDPASGGGFIVTGGDGALTIGLPVALADLDDLAIRQVVCTAAHSAGPDGLRRIRLSGTDGSTEPSRCDAGVTGGRPAPRPAVSGHPVEPDAGARSPAAVPRSAATGSGR
ncbi:hypothetical protein [Streptomyces sp. CAU 1734]|uniref:hypothetical protein n=1 Tax=Streptomyces sp. CAU 1734 TaxID=3140360 RepID=UPI0032608F26